MTTPDGFDKFDSLARKLVKVTPDAVSSAKSPWASYMEIFPKTSGKIMVRWCGYDGVYRWLHPVSRKWIEENDQIYMPTFPDYKSARMAADESPEPPTWQEFILHRE